MHRILFGCLFAASLTFATTGCDEQQYDSAVEDYNEEKVETREEVGDAIQDGVVTKDEREDLSDAGEDLQEAAGEVAEQRGDLIESRTD